MNHCTLAGDGRRLVSASDDATLRVWDLDAPESPPVVLRGHEGGVSHCTLAGDGRRLVSASDDATLRVWDLDAPESPPVVLRGHEGWVHHCTLAGDGRRLVSASYDATLRVWDLDAREEIARFRAVSAVTWVGWAKDDRWVLAADAKRAGLVLRVDVVARGAGLSVTSRRAWGGVRAGAVQGVREAGTPKG